MTPIRREVSLVGDKTAIEWTDATWNPTTGCDRVSPGCDNCYALKLAGRLKKMGSPRYQADGGERSGPGFGLTLHSDSLLQPRRWTKPRRIFVNSMSDLFHAEVPREFIYAVFDEMAMNGRHTFQVLTKRAERMERVVRTYAELATSGPYPAGWPHPHIWLGVSVETTDYYSRIHHLQRTPAAVRFLSCEPLLGPLPDLPLEGIHWVIVGGESGPGARPMHPQWVRDIRDQCLSAGVAFFMKQWGAFAPWAPDDWSEPRGTNVVNLDGTGSWVAGDHDHLTNWGTHLEPGWSFATRVGKKAAGRELDGRTWDEYPTPTGVAI